MPAKKSKYPFVVAKSAQSLDGKIATASGHSKWMTSPETRRFARRKRNHFDAILVGVNTVLADNPRLSAPQRSKRIKKVVLDSTLRTSPRAKLFKNTRPGQCFIFTTQRAPKRKIEQFVARGVHVFIAPQRGRHVSLKWALKKLYEHKVKTVLMEGGAHVIGRALKQKLVDQMHIYIAPKIIGDQKALSSVVGLNVLNVNQAVQLKDVRTRKIGKDLFIQGYVYRNR